jgi:hypothetical protein
MSEQMQTATQFGKYGADTKPAYYPVSFGHLAVVSVLTFKSWPIYDNNHPLRSTRHGNKGIFIMLRNCGAIVITLSLLTAATPVAQELDRVTVVISQPTAPVAISNFETNDRGGRFTADNVERSSRGFRWRNIVDRVIVAVEIGVVECDVWHQFLEYSLYTDFTELEPGDDEDGGYSFSQNATRYQLSTIQTPFAYVSRVMFEDGEIWEGDLEQIAEEIRRVENDFDSSFFNEDNLRGWGSLFLSE